VMGGQMRGMRISVMLTVTLACRRNTQTNKR
jgi:hypothetical protein